MPTWNASMNLPEKWPSRRSGTNERKYLDADVKQRLLPDAEVPYRFHFTPEDFYVFVLSHAYKHYSSSGTGVRTLADIYIMNQKLGGTLNWEYVDSELQGLGIFSYERESRELAQKLFGSAELPTEANLSEAEQQMLAYYLGASTYLLDILLQGSPNEEQQLLNGKEVTALGKAIERCKETEKAA